MMFTNPNGWVCPYCGLLFFTISERTMQSCPGCGRRWKIAEEEALEACLTAE